MKTAHKKYGHKPLTIDQAAGEGSMMEFSGVRSDEEMRLMSEWTAKRKAELALKGEVISPTPASSILKKTS